MTWGVAPERIRAVLKQESHRREPGSFKCDSTPVELTRLAEEQALARDEVLESLVQAAERHGIWDDVLRLQSVTSDASQERFTRFVEERHPELVGRLGQLRRRP